MKKRTLLFICLATMIVGLAKAQNLVGLGGGQEYSYNKLALKSPLFASSYLLAEDSIKHPLKLVLYYQINGDYFKRRVLDGGDYEFMHRELTGFIELYSVIRTTTSYDPVTGVPMSSSSKVGFYSKNNQEFRKLKGKNLMEDLSDCGACIQEVKKAKTLGIISAIGLTAGLGIFVGTAATDLSERPEPGESTGIPAGAIIGPALCFTPVILGGPRRRHFINAISIYNESH